jgi:uncharacterized integral membrane protein
MRNFLKFIVIAPVALVFLAFALANRQTVTVSFDPFNSGDIPSPQIVLPLFIILFGATMFGVLLGGIASWLGAGRHRKAARAAIAAAETLRGENASLRDELKALKSAAVPVANGNQAMITRGAA